MTTDLTFITNDGDTSLRDRFNDLLTAGKGTRYFDCLVGYFFISGFYRLYSSLETTEKIRILIGLKTDLKTYSLIKAADDQLQTYYTSFAETKELVPSTILDELESSPDTSRVELGIKKFIQWTLAGKLEIKAYPSANIHAKVYIMTFHEGDRDKGRVITGSSNFSQSGLSDNLEFNVELKNRSDFEFALEQFNTLWQYAVDVSKEYIETIQHKSPYAHFTPYELYLKLLYEYFKGELNASEAASTIYLPMNFKKLRYQNDAVVSAKKILDEYGGVFISDVVGLGKTYISAMLAQQLDGRTLVLAPPSLLDKNNPGSWPNVFEDFQVPQANFESIGKLDELLRRGIEKYSNVFIDEAHRFRTEATSTYEKLAQICRGKRVILVTATPLNNSPMDILSQIKLFQNGRNSTIPNVRDLDSFFGSMEKKLKEFDRKENKDDYLRTIKSNAKNIREKVLKYLMIRRTRGEIEKYYNEDLKSQGLKFPEISDPEPLFYQFSPDESKVFRQTISLLANSFTYARYKPLAYYVGESIEDEVQAQRNVAKFMKILLVKRLESSFYAFRLSLERFIGSYERFIQEFKQGNVYISKRYTNRIFEWLDDDNVEAIQQLIDEEKAEKLKASDFSDKFYMDLQNDLQILKEIFDLWLRIKRDPKWDAFYEILTTNANLQSNKLVIFTESKETARYLQKMIKTDLREDAIVFSGESSQITRKTIIANFDARAFKPEDEYRILVTTEVLSEGVNLHKSNIVINYDIPWNPTRLIQRVGRVNRIDTKFQKIYTYNFFPTEESNDLIKLKEAAEAKIQAFIEMLGADARLLTDGEEIKSHDLFNQLNSRKTITGEDENEESELEYLKEIREIRDGNPELFARIKHLPKKARAARISSVKADSLVTYFRKGKLEKFFLAQSSSQGAQEIDFFEAVQLLRSDPKQIGESVDFKFYDLLERNRQAFVQATTEDIIASSGGPSRDNATRVLKRLKAIQKYAGYTDEDDEFMRRVKRLLEDGSLPKPTTKKLVSSLNEESSPLKILAILRRDIPLQFFQETRVDSGHSISSKREVILSAYLVPS